VTQITAQEFFLLMGTKTFTYTKGELVNNQIVDTYAAPSGVKIQHAYGDEQDTYFVTEGQP